MKLPEAKAELDDMLYRRTISLNEEQKQSLQLGSEALEFLIRWRDKAEIQPYPLLRSETT